MAQTKTKRPYKPKAHGHSYQKPKPNKPGGVFIDFHALPASLSEDEYKELVKGLPKAKGRGKPSPVDHTDLLAANLNEMHVVAEEEGMADFVGRNRRDAIWEITTQRLNSHIPVIAEGVLDEHGKGHYFLRTHSRDYIPAEEDVFVPQELRERYGLVQGMTVRGPLRPVREGEKYLCLHDVEMIDGADPEEANGRAPFKELVPLYPEERIILEGAADNPLEMRIVDLITPVGRGQRGLIVAPPRTGKTVLLQMLAQSVVANAPDAHLIILLVDERPEEVTDFERSVKGDKVEVVSSTFDEPAARHIQVAERVIERAKNMVEAGSDVVILLDSITRLARSCNVEAPSNGKLLSGGLEATALQFPKRFFGAARNMENGGSLTILGTALIETGSKMDEVIFEEFKGTGNMEIVLDRRISDRRIFPAIDINRSGTRKEELLFTPEEIERIWMLRKVLNELDPVEAMEMLIQKMRKTSVNAEFLMTIGS
ncbi:MAG: transcription termination factor Rho [Planctomycetota bacterium]|jgi:transcription termination factor Rho|nr:transcription termination factor Rho [Planctomycetota bacterium]